MNVLLQKVLTDPAARTTGTLPAAAAGAAKEFRPWASVDG